MPRLFGERPHAAKRRRRQKGRPRYRRRRASAHASSCAYPPRLEERSTSYSIGESLLSLLKRSLQFRVSVFRDLVVKERSVGRGWDHHRHIWMTERERERERKRERGIIIIIIIIIIITTTTTLQTTLDGVRV